MRNVLGSLAPLLAVLVALGCGSNEAAPSTGANAAEPSEPAPSVAAAETEEAPAEAEEPSAPAPSQVSDGETYQLNAVVIEGGYARGELASFSVHLEGAGEFHMNEDFPVRITMSGPDHVEFPSPTLDRAAAAEFTEEHARFDIPFVANTAGEHQVEADIRFAVCNPSSCLTKTARVGVVVAVNDADAPTANTPAAEGEALPEADSVAN